MRRSIDSDVDNVATLLRLSGLVPRALDLAPLLAEAKRQLHEEADYVREASCLTRFGALLADDPGFVVPALVPELSTGDILAMTFASGAPIETLVAAPQAVRDAIATRLIDLTLRELFVFGTMQTDPNPANYGHDPASARIVLLDFGATQDVPAEAADGYRTMLAAALSGDAAAATDAMAGIGLIDAATPPTHRAELTAMFVAATAPLRTPGPYDFGDPSTVRALRDRGMALAADRAAWRVPPVAMLFVQRKLGGVYLIATRLRARVELRAMLERYA